MKKKVGIYWQLGSEVNTRPAIAALHEHGFKISILSSEENKFIFRKWTSDQSIQKNKLGYKADGSIMEAPNIIICPILCFDNACNRLGRGGGHYDRILRSYPNSLKIGLAYSQQFTNKIHMEKHDVQMDIIVTEKKVHFKRYSVLESNI